MNSWSAMQTQLRQGLSWSGHEPNVALINTGGGRFYDISYVSGLLYSDDARAVVFIDWDGDGDLDVWLRNRTGPQVRLLLNQTETGGNSIAVRLIGTQSNKDAIGARVEVLGAGRALHDTVRAGSGFLAQGTKWLHFGLGDHAAPVSLRVRWPSGLTQTFQGIRPNQRYVLTEGSSEAKAQQFDEALSWPEERIPEAHFSRTGSVVLAYPPRLPIRTAKSLDGKLVPLVGDDVTLINLWASWCAACKKEMAEFQRARKRLESAGVRIVALTVDEPKDLDAARKQVQDGRFWFETGIADQQVLMLYQALQRVITDREQDIVLPSSILVNREGRVVKLYTGAIAPEDLVADARRLGEATLLNEDSAVPWPGRWDGIIREHSALICSLRLAEHLSSLKSPELAVEVIGDVLDMTEDYVPPESILLRIANVYHAVADGGRQLGCLASLCRKTGDAIAARAAASLASKVADEPFAGTWWDQMVKAFNTVRTQSVREALVTTVMSGKLPRPSDADGNRIYGLYLFNGGLYKHALPYLREALRLNAMDANSRYRLGVSLVKSGSVEEGVRHINAALSVLPPWDMAEVQVADALAAVGKKDLALQHYRRAMAINPQNDAARKGISALDQ
jgi:tetratricopeptide (TPR) repeat protein